MSDFIEDIDFEEIEVNKNQKLTFKEFEIDPDSYFKDKAPLLCFGIDYEEMPSIGITVMFEQKIGIFNFIK